MCFAGGRQSAGRVALPPGVDITLAVIKPHAVAAGLAGGPDLTSVSSNCCCHFFILLLSFTLGSQLLLMVEVS